MNREKVQLFQELDIALKYGNRPEIPLYITENLRYPLFTWQEKALLNFLIKIDLKAKENDTTACHFLFNMATGTGKTLLIAALILYYYKQGYRSFIFFVNQNNIVGKTEENLTNPQHNKYLFRQNIIIDDKTIEVKKVETFSNQTDNIEILFTTVHKLHNAIYTVKENSVYLEDLQKRDIIMLGDEAHHLNADTKKKKGEQLEIEDLNTELKEGASETDLEKSWENTICKKILERKKTGAHNTPKENKNVLLEFTATVPRDASVIEKYSDKIIYKFDLPDFLNAGYTKEINLVTSTSDKKQIILQALLFNWYRNKIALRNGLNNFKPIILFRSKKIEDSETDFKSFQELVYTLSAKDFDFLKDIKDEKTDEGKALYLKGKSRIIDIKHFISENNIELFEIIDYLKYHFSKNHCIITNSKDRSAKGKRGEEKTTDEQDKLLNSLEDKNNTIQAIFTVQRLNEGWDVLNLFDIVRLYEGRDEGKTISGDRKAGLATISEVQLIGRGIRYYPFDFENKPRLKRKFDDDLNHEMRVLEEFYFHSYDDDKSRYIDELKRELKNKGFIDDSRKSKIFTVKKSFEENPFYRTVKLWLNKCIPNPNARKLTLQEIAPDFEFTHLIEAFRLHEESILLDKQEDKEKYTTKTEESRTLSFVLKEFEKHIILKALNIKAAKDQSLFRYKNIKNELALESIDEILKDDFLGCFPINIISSKNYTDLQSIPNKIQLKILLRFLDKVENQLKDISSPHIGSDFEQTTFMAVLGKPAERVVNDTDESIELEKKLKQNEWYVLDSFTGTSEEIELINFLTETMENLKERYEKIFLLRNEQVYTIYDFTKGRGFQPDYLLLLKQKEKENYLQVFIEPKGDQFKDSKGGFTESKEGWKEKFLHEISDKHTQLIDTEEKEYRLIGTPFFNKKNKEVFRKEYNKALALE